MDFLRILRDSQDFLWDLFAVDWDLTRIFGFFSDFWCFYDNFYGFLGISMDFLRILKDSQHYLMDFLQLIRI